MKMVGPTMLSFFEHEYKFNLCGKVIYFEMPFEKLAIFNHQPWTNFSKGRPAVISEIEVTV